jgi:hypothetical protein
MNLVRQNGQTFRPQKKSEKSVTNKGSQPLESGIPY